MTGSVFADQTGGAIATDEEFFGVYPDDEPEPGIFMVGHILVDNGGTTTTGTGETIQVRPSMTS